MDFLSHPDTDRIIEGGLAEDVGPGDYSSLSVIPPGRYAQARCLIKEPGVLAGAALAQRVFARVDAALEFVPLLPDGSPVAPGDVPFTVAGDPRSILTAERLVLNLMQRMSGIATRTRQVADLIRDTGCRVLDTRKTTPLIRHVEKWAVQIGGGVNHRFGLYDMVMIKDNHTDYAGGILPAIRACQAWLADRNLRLEIVVEARTLAEVEEVLAAGGVRRVLLDNMSPGLMRQAVRLVDGRIETEASGGITPETVRAYAETGVTYVSMGALTHSVKSLDISLKAVKP
ncbi:MAG: carboxylating nicotinate-nucleotide diphosphorylase [Bacteroidia bacterium]|nr:carboxylating nicotinate-nucleotide diphosphorylase [Bacteroidia bacterium]